MFCLISASGVRVMLNFRRGFGGRFVIIELFESEFSLVMFATKVADPASVISVISDSIVFVRRFDLGNCVKFLGLHGLRIPR